MAGRMQQETSAWFHCQGLRLKLGSGGERGGEEGRREEERKGEGRREKSRYTMCEMLSYLLVDLNYKAHVLVAQSCLSLCDPMNYSLPGSSVHGIFQARRLEWVAISFSRGDLPDSRVEPGSPALQSDALLSEPSGEA